ncbi:hypothetical protein [Oceanobacillus massiliensis]|uniref:hypothetical protein n=1 Tax=Oceanobacillus massiliensis TaxID=1465765 RepID=UPI00028A0280|nr:hypothetical protein [Oceanobacillus massiliensis]
MTATSTVTEAEDFLLHLRIEEIEGGIQIQHSLQYIGADRIIIEHQTPLVSVSYNEFNHDFTGSHVSMELDSGDIYPQLNALLPFPEHNKDTLYIQANFTANGKRIQIEHVEELNFQ